MTSREISTKSLTIYFQNMMNDGIHLASNSTPEQYLRLVWIKGASRALNFGVLKTWDRLAHLLPVARTRSQVAKTASLGIWMKHIRLNFHKNISKSNQIKSLLLSHHHSTCALVSEILESGLQIVQKQFTYRQYIQTYREDNV